MAPYLPPRCPHGRSIGDDGAGCAECQRSWEAAMAALPGTIRVDLPTLAVEELHDADDLPTAPPHSTRMNAAEEREYEAYVRWADHRPADDVQFEVRT
ncbi:MAG: hypothetical protein PHS14_16555 [Elusimicrobia bacterium]|nr:hypothetical protein [Elusimicrobiota bacterium]